MKPVSILLVAMTGLLGTPLWAESVPAAVTVIERPATDAPRRPIVRVETETALTSRKPAPAPTPAPAPAPEAEEPRCEDQSNWDERGWAFLGRRR